MECFPRVLEPPEAKASADRSDGDARAVPHPMILVVDDDAGIREALADALRDERYVVATAANGREALEMMSQGLRPAAVLLDLWMPELDGATTLLAIRCDDRVRETPVIVVTAAQDTLDAAVTSHADAIFRKPIDLNRLLAAVDRFRLRESS